MTTLTAPARPVAGVAGVVDVRPTRRRLGPGAPIRFGGLIGIVVGLAVSAGIAGVAGWTFAFDATTVVAAVGFSLAVGVVFGVWPARQAARLDPIHALRYE